MNTLDSATAVLPFLLYKQSPPPLLADCAAMLGTDIDAAIISQQLLAAGIFVTDENGKISFEPAFGNYYGICLKADSITAVKNGKGKTTGMIYRRGENFVALTTVGEEIQFRFVPEEFATKLMAFTLGINPEKTFFRTTRPLPLPIRIYSHLLGCLDQKDDAAIADYAHRAGWDAEDLKDFLEKVSDEKYPDFLEVTTELTGKPAAKIICKFRVDDEALYGLRMVTGLRKSSAILQLLTIDKLLPLMTEFSQ